MQCTKLVLVRMELESPNSIALCPPSQTAEPVIIHNNKIKQ